MAYIEIIHQGRKRLRWYPDNATRFTHKQQLAVAYVYITGKSNRTAVVAYEGNAAKPAFHESYSDMHKAAKRIANYFDALTERKARQAQRRVESNSGHTLKVGDIIVNSWGYDQTNVDWYRVERVSSCFVWLIPVRGACVPDAGVGPMSGYSLPFVDTSASDASKWGFTAVSNGKLTKHKAQGNSCSMRFGCGSLWDGRAKYESWYA